MQTRCSRISILPEMACCRGHALLTCCCAQCRMACYLAGCGVDVPRRFRAPAHRRPAVRARASRAAAKSSSAHHEQREPGCAVPLGPARRLRPRECALGLRGAQLSPPPACTPHPDQARVHVRAHLSRFDWFGCSRVNCVPSTFQPSSDPSTGWHHRRR